MYRLAPSSHSSSFPNMTLEVSPTNATTSLNTQYEIPTGSIIPHLLLFIAPIAALSSNVFPGRRLFYSIAIIYLAISANLNHFTLNPGIAQFFSLAWPHYLCVLSNLLFSSPGGPESELWRIDRLKGEALNYRAFSPAKIKWGLVIWWNLRGIRWNSQAKNVPKGPEPEEFTKWAFVRLQVFKFLRTLLVVDLISQLTIWMFHTAEDGTVGGLDSKYITARDPNWVRSFVKTLLMGVGPFFFMLSEYVFGAIVSVGLGWSKPEVRSAPNVRVTTELTTW
jgi:gliotoxin/aspirochlorine biosynthesis aminotransferase